LLNLGDQKVFGHDLTHLDKDKMYLDMFVVEMYTILKHPVTILSTGSVVYLVYIFIGDDSINTEWGLEEETNIARGTCNTNTQWSLYFCHPTGPSSLHQTRTGKVRAKQYNGLYM